MVSEQLVALSICFLCLSVRESLCIWLSADQYHDQLLIYRQVTDWKVVFIGINFYVMLNVNWLICSGNGKLWLICSGNGKRTSTFVTTLIPSMVCLTYRFGVWVILHPLSVTFQWWDAVLLLRCPLPLFFRGGVTWNMASFTRQRLSQSAIFTSGRF